MRENFEKAFEKVIGHEGGFTNHRKDRGNWTSGKVGVGELKGTKYGVSAMAYPNLDIRNLTLDDARAIYKRDYWDAVKGDELPSGVDFLTFDMAVNHGNGRAARFLQEGAGVKADGVIGPITMGKVYNTDPETLLIEMSAIRGLFYSQISTVKVFGRGWYRRQVKTLVEALGYLKPALDQSKGSVLGGLFRRV